MPDEQNGLSRAQISRLIELMAKVLKELEHLAQREQVQENALGSILEVCSGLKAHLDRELAAQALVAAEVDHEKTNPGIRPNRTLMQSFQHLATAVVKPIGSLLDSRVGQMLMQAIVLGLAGWLAVRFGIHIQPEIHNDLPYTETPSPVGGNDGE